MKKILLMGMVAVLLLGKPMWCAAQAAEAPSAGALKPVVTVTLSGYDQILGALGAINPQFAVGAESALNSLTGNQGLQGLDKKRPIGLLIRTDDQQFPAQLVLPVTDLTQLLKSLEPTLGPAKEKEGVYQLESGDRTFYLKQVGEWAFASIDANSLSNLPENPLEAFGGLQEQYDLGIRLTVKNIPAIFRQMGIGLLQSLSQQGLEKRPNETDEQLALRTQAFEQTMKQLNQLVNELDTVVAGLKLEGKEGKAALEGVVTAIEGTDLAKQYAAAMQATETNFGGFLAEDAALTWSAAQKVPEANVGQLEASLATARESALKDLENQELSEQDLALAKDLLGQLLDVVKATIQGGKIDVGGAVKLAPDALTVIAGGHLLDTAKVDTILKKLVEKATADEPKLAEMIKLNAEEYQGIHFHRVTLPLESMEESEVLEKLVGKELEIFVGIGPESVYVAAGRDALETLKKAIDQSKTSTPVLPMQIKLAATPLVKCLGALSDDEKAKNVANVLGQILTATPNQDHINITSTAVPNGGKFRIELESGILKVLGLLPMLSAGL